MKFRSEKEEEREKEREAGNRMYFSIFYLLMYCRYGRPPLGMETVLHKECERIYGVKSWEEFYSKIDLPCPSKPEVHSFPSLHLSLPLLLPPPCLHLHSTNDCSFSLSLSLFFSFLAVDYNVEASGD